MADLLAQERWQAGDLDRAVQLLAGAVAEAREVYPQGHARRFASEVRLAGLSWLRGDRSRAEELLELAESSKDAPAMVPADRRAFELLRGLLHCAFEPSVTAGGAPAAAIELQNEPSLVPWLRTPWRSLPTDCLPKP